MLIGPGDLSVSFRQHPVPDVYGVDAIDVFQDTITKCQQVDKKTAAFSFNTVAVSMLNGLCVDIIPAGLDVTYIADGLKSHFPGLDFR